MLLPIAAQMEWKVYQFYIKSDFLNDYVNENVYIEQPEGVVIQGNENKIYKLKKGIIWVEASTESMVWEIIFISL